METGEMGEFELMFSMLCQESSSRLVSVLWFYGLFSPLPSTMILTMFNLKFIRLCVS